MKLESAFDDATGRSGAAASDEPGRAQATRPRRSGNPDFMLSLARGLQVARAMARRKHPSTVSQLSLETGLARSVVRRCLYTLTEIGLADRSDRRRFLLSPHIRWLADGPPDRWPRTLDNA